MKPPWQVLRIISYMIIGLVLISCGISIACNDIYQDGAWANAQWLGQDVVSLFIVAPILWLAQHRAISKQSYKWMIVLGGVLFYFVYTYAFYMFAAKLTFLYLLHLPIFGLSVFGLIILLFVVLNPNLEIINQSTRSKKITAIFFWLISLMLTFLWISDILGHLTVPDYLSTTPDGEAPLIIYSLDLAIVIPLMFIAAIGLWRGLQLGLKVTGIMLVKVSTLGFALMAMSLSMMLNELSVDIELIILWCIIGLFGTLLSIIYLKSTRIFVKP